MATSEQLDINMFCATAEDVMASDLSTPLDDLLSGLLSPADSLPPLHEDFLSSFISDEPWDTTDPPLALRRTPTPPLSLCEHSTCHFESWQDVVTSFARLDQTERVRVVHAM
ncbi:hypothetical protein BWQ96_07788 [Gracilariopsis chorda]|uniref:Uncharacterized protein n=1 Tax=Gracilariopsis chorda TaxID=448386 RepID=A0A2V3IKA2_9FLOR|nr:hypothetical protein BWQ96_07788 [Gracilariopsis chorda]|eukprot:PXF42479.1 hypothetical protein BWQ96_07788 [Gracilariopsis chorda]